MLRVDAMALGQVLDNLLFNAVKFSPGGATITVGLLHEDGFWRCEVGDDGPGISVEEQASLFQKFHRGSARAAQDDEEGSGLGLFIAATLMKAMGGGIEYRQRQGRGAAFVLTFDVAGRTEPS